MSRNVSNVADYGLTRVYTTVPPSGPPVTTEYRFPNQVLLDWKRSDVTLNKPSAKGWRKPSPYESDVQRNTPAVGVCAYDEMYAGVDLVRQHRLTGLLFAGYQHEKTSLSYNTEQALLANALSKVKDSSINLALAIAEANKTLDFLASNLRNLVKALGLARKKDWPALARHLGMKTTYKKGSGKVASRWLEYKYGWMPLLMDIHGAIEALTKLAREEDFLVVAKAKRAKSRGFVVTRSDGIGSLQPYEHVINIDETTKVSLWYKMNLPKLALASQLGFTSPLMIAWELVPFSFVWDWVMPIGDVIDAFDADFGMDYMGGSCTYFCRSTARSTAKNGTFGNAYDWKVFSSGGSGDSSRVIMSRKIYDTSPLVGVYVKNPFSTDHVITSLALLRSLKR